MSDFEIMLLAILILILIAFLRILYRTNEVAEKQDILAENQEILTERLDAILKMLNLYRQGELKPIETVDGYTDTKGKWVIMRKGRNNG